MQDILSTMFAWICRIPYRPQFRECIHVTPVVTVPLQICIDLQVLCQELLVVSKLRMSCWTTILLHRVFVWNNHTIFSATHHSLAQIVVHADAIVLDEKVTCTHAKFLSRFGLFKWNFAKNSIQSYNGFTAGKTKRSSRL